MEEKLREIIRDEIEEYFLEKNEFYSEYKKSEQRCKYLEEENEKLKLKIARLECELLTQNYPKNICNSKTQDGGFNF